MGEPSRRGQRDDEQHRRIPTTEANSPPSRAPLSQTPPLQPRHSQAPSRAIRRHPHPGTHKPRPASPSSCCQGARGPWARCTPLLAPPHNLLAPGMIPQGQDRPCSRLLARQAPHSLPEHGQHRVRTASGEVTGKGRRRAGGPQPPGLRLSTEVGFGRQAAGSGCQAPGHEAPIRWAARASRGHAQASFRAPVTRVAAGSPAGCCCQAPRAAEMCREPEIAPCRQVQGARFRNSTRTRRASPHRASCSTCDGRATEQYLSRGSDPRWPHSPTGSEDRCRGTAL